MEEKKFYQKGWFTILLLILFWPAGLIVMWCNNVFNKNARIVITALFLLILIGYIASGKENNTTVSTTTVNETNQVDTTSTTETTTIDVEATTNIITTETTTVNLIFEGNLNAEKIGNRGTAAEGTGRKEPNYVNEIGYLATRVTSSYPYPDTDIINNTNWTVNTYRQLDADHYEINGTLPHKTMVKVISQNLEHRGWGGYSGMLTVENLSNNQQYLISVSDFVLNPYWRNNITDAIKDGAVVCQYNNINKDYLPCDKSNEIVNLAENTKVLAVHKTGAGSGVNSEALNITCLYYNQYNEYDEIFINENDLKILY